MATHDYVIDNQTAPSFRSDLNSALLAIVTQNSSATAPSTTYADMFWYDSANNQLKKRNEANSAWVTLGTIDEVLGTFTPSGGQFTIASQAEAEAGVDNTKVMTPLRTEQNMLANVLGRSQTWQDVTASRAGNTSYQNLTGRPISVSLRLGSTSVAFQVSSDNVTFLSIAAGSTTSATTVGGIIPPSHYYRLNGTPTITGWFELR
jgi:hypothetical protein